MSDNLKTLQSIAKSMDNPVIQWAAAEIARLREERRWISVGARLPQDNVPVLCWVDGSGPEMAFRKNGKWLLTFVCYEVSDLTYTHWQPLPPVLAEVSDE